ncbi:MAG: hypothetical protein K2X87_27870 [Gemmataceae bacterium]|nr:hypothetical protein [Gemmataceae bacterium]
MLLAGVLLVTLAAPGDAQRLPKGTELTYTGTVTEAVDRPGQRYRRTHDLEVRVLVVDRRPGWADAAVLTLLRRTDEAPDSHRLPSPPAVRLEMVRLPDDGPAHRLSPAGPLPPVPLDAFAPAEVGMFPAPGAWTPAGWGFVAAERCQELRFTDQSAGWDRPRPGETAWRRADAVWVSAGDGVARRVERTVAQRDGAGKPPAVLIETRYELRDQARLLGRTFDRYRREVELAHAGAAEAGQLLAAGRVAPKQIDTRLARLAEYLDETDPGTPYREAVLAVRRQWEAARRGEVGPTGTSPPAAPTGRASAPRP